MRKKLHNLLLFTILFHCQLLLKADVKRLNICQNRGVIFTETVTSGTPTAYTWNLGNGTLAAGGSINGNVAGPVNFPLGVHLVTVKVDFTSGSSSIDSFEVTAFAYAVPRFTFNDTVICGNVNLNLGTNTQGNQYRYLWRPAGQTTRTLGISAAGNYGLSVYSVDDFTYLLGACDSAWSNFAVRVGAPASVELGPTVNICSGVSAILDAGAGYTDYTWLPGNQKTQTLSVNAPGLYSVQVVNADGCSATDNVLVRDSCPVVVNVPNSFTPVINGLNDIFIWRGNAIFTSYRFRIFTRWGEKVFDTQDPTQGWDGKFDGKMCPEGVYAWYLEGIDTNRNKHIKRGNVTLLID